MGWETERLGVDKSSDLLGSRNSLLKRAARFRISNPTQDVLGFNLEDRVPMPRIFVHLEDTDAIVIENRLPDGSADEAFLNIPPGGHFDFEIQLLMSEILGQLGVLVDSYSNGTRLDIELWSEKFSAIETIANSRNTIQRSEDVFHLPWRDFTVALPE